MGSFIRHEECPKCGKNNLAIYDDGINTCFTMDCGHKEKNGSVEERFKVSSIKPITPLYEGGVYQDIKSRGLSKKTCERLGIRCVKINGVKTFIFEGYDHNGSLARQKFRPQDEKKYWSKGNTGLNTLFGQHAFAPTDKFPIYITEGEFDAAAIVEATGYAATSVINGAQSAKKDILNNIEYLKKWKYVVLVFDQDEAGKKAVQECVNLLGPGGIRIAHLPLKDANAMVLAGRGGELKSFLWNAQETKPSHIVSTMDIIDDILKQSTKGVNWAWPSMTDITFGMQGGDFIVVAGGTGVGKTEFVKDILCHAIYKEQANVAIFSGEQRAGSTSQRIIGSNINQVLHIPGTVFDTQLVRKQAELIHDKLFLYNKSGVFDLDDILSSIEYLVKAKEVKVAIIDNLKSLEAHFKDKFNGVSDAMAKIKGCANDLNIPIILMCHLNRDMNTKAKEEQDRSWRNGRVPVLENIYGNSAIEAWADYCFGLSRNCNADDFDQSKRVLRVEALKARLVGSKSGNKFFLEYKEETGKLEESVGE